MFYVQNYHIIMCIDISSLNFLLSTTDAATFFTCIRFKGHGMLAPFTAGWQSTDLHPLVIDRSEVLQFGIVLNFFSIDSQIIAQDLEHVAFHVDFSS